jgi:hypothetical protein
MIQLHMDFVTALWTLSHAGPGKLGRQSYLRLQDDYGHLFPGARQVHPQLKTGLTESYCAFPTECSL